MAVEVNYTTLQEQAKNIINSFSDLNYAIEDANQAAETAVLSVGGDSTRVGKAVSSALQELTLSEIASAKTVVSDLAATLKNVSNTYEEEDNFLVDRINNIADQTSITR